MKHATRAIAMVIAGLLLLCATCALAQDWPQWRGIHRDGKVAGFTAPATWPKAFTQKWQVNVGASDSTPALVGDKLYVFARQVDNEVTLCLNANDGKELWRDTFAVQAITPPSSRDHPGPRSSPAVADGKVVTLGVRGTLTCLDAATGKVLWRKDEFPGEVPQFYTSSSPLIDNGIVIALLGGAGNGAIIAYNLATGEQQWKWTGEGPDYGSPVVATIAGVKQIITLTEKSLVGVSFADGKLLWQVSFPPARMAYNADTPIVDGDTVIFSGASRGTKAVKIDHQGDAFSATELWSNPAVSVQFNSPVLKDGQLYGLTAQGNLFCLDAKTGKTGWMDTTAHGQGFAAIVDAGSCLLALPSTSELIAFKPDATAYTELANIKVADTATYAYPIVIGKNIYVKDQPDADIVDDRIRACIDTSYQTNTPPPRMFRWGLSAFYPQG